ncbi:the Ing1 Phd finger in complex with A histone H3k4me3 peptide, partial [Dichotomocladium elegans]
NEPLYCYCRQVSFGEMVGCDGEHCPYEWFHMECVGLDAPPKGAWYCDHCRAE